MDLTIIIPIRNQTAKLVKNLAEKILPFFDAHHLDYEILIGSDSSNEENERALAEALKTLPPFVKHLPYENVKGKDYALKKGLIASKGDYVLYMDADLSTDLKAFDEMWKIRKDYALLIGTRHNKKSDVPVKQGLFRRFISFGSRTLIKWRFHFKGVTDTQCGFKMFEGKMARLAGQRQIILGWSSDVEYIYFVQLNKLPMKEVPVRWVNDPDSTMDTLKVSKEFYKELGVIKRNKKNYLLSEAEKEGLPNAH
jgi:dolichyl-phosphate beta-glucosyltransferase